MTSQERLDKLQALEDAASPLLEALTYAKVLARMEVQGRTPERSTVLDKVDEAIVRWNTLINLLPRELKAIKLSLIEGKQL